MKGPVSGLTSPLVETISVIILLFICQPNYALDVVKAVQKAANVFDTADITTQKTSVSSSGPDISRSKKYVYLTGATYCSDLSKWDCEYCKKSQSLGYEYSGNVSNSASNTFGVIVVNKAAKEIVLVFRGTYNVANILQDATLAQTGISGGGSKKSGNTVKKSKVRNGKKGKSSAKSSTIKVHNGFLKATKSVYPQVVQKLGALLKKNKGYSVVIAGHSLGASMASITLYMLKHKMNVPSSFPTPSYAFFGFGQPRTGNQAYADYWNSQKMPVTRIVSKADIIPHLPPASMGYVHHGTELWISSKGDKSCSKTVYEDPNCSDSIGPAYLPTDHVQYWDVTYVAQCAVKNPIAVLKQLVIPVG